MVLDSVLVDKGETFGKLVVVDADSCWRGDLAVEVVCDLAQSSVVELQERGWGGKI